MIELERLNDNNTVNLLLLLLALLMTAELVLLEIAARSYDPFISVFPAGLLQRIAVFCLVYVFLADSVLLIPACMLYALSVWLQYQRLQRLRHPK